NCPKCGKEFLAANENDRACPKCLMQFAMEPTQTANQQFSGIENEPILPSGAKLGQYEIREMLGRGGMGTVYKVFQPMLDRFVAIKVLPAKLSADQEFITRFNREAKALAGLSHQNIVGIYDIAQEGNQFYFVMEFVEGVTVRQLIEERKLPPEEALKIVSQLCEALEYAHSEGVVHRDIKPENILIDKKGMVKIADFGLARIVRGDVRIDPVTKTQEVMGTIDYMAPEQRTKAKDVDHRADIYSLGVVFYEMLTGELPIGKFELPSRKVQIDVRVDDIVMKTLEREPSKRYQRVSEVGTAVSQILSGTAEPITIVPSSQTPRYSTLSILSLVVAFIPVCITQLLGIIFGIMAIRRINRSDGQLKGTGLAIAGIVSSIIVGIMFVPIVAAIAIPSLLSSKAMIAYQNQKNIPEILEKLALAQEIYRRADLDGNHQDDYIHSIKDLCAVPGIDAIIGSDIKSIALADQSGQGTNTAPYRNYLYRCIPWDVDSDKTDDYYPYSFAFVAYPADSRGKTFVVDERRIIYFKNMGNLQYPDEWQTSPLVRVGENAWMGTETKRNFDPATNGWQVEKRLEISEAMIQDTYQQIRKFRPELPEKLLTIAEQQEAKQKAQREEMETRDKEEMFAKLVAEGKAIMESAKNTNDKNSYNKAIKYFTKALSIKDDVGLRKLIEECKQKPSEMSSEERSKKSKQLAASLEMAKTIKGDDEYEKGKTIYEISRRYAEIGEYDRALETTKLIENDLWKSQAIQEINRIKSK
ncbi:MAG: protein kinase, partial [Planctomycetota bacterium]